MEKIAGSFLEFRSWTAAVLSGDIFRFVDVAPLLTAAGYCICRRFSSSACAAANENRQGVLKTQGNSKKFRSAHMRKLLISFDLFAAVASCAEDPIRPDRKLTPRSRVYQCDRQTNQAERVRQQIKWRSSAPHRSRKTPGVRRVFWPSAGDARALRN